MTTAADHVWIGLPLLLVPILVALPCLVCLLSGVPANLLSTPIGNALTLARRSPPEQLVAAGRRVLDDRVLVERLQAQGVTTRVELSDLPEELRDLGRIGVSSEGDRIHTYLGGGFGGWGLIILREGAPPPERDPMVTHREVCPGLWAWGE